MADNTTDGAKKARRSQFEVMLEASDKLTAEQKVLLRDRIQKSLDDEGKALADKLAFIANSSPKSNN